MTVSLHDVAEGESFYRLMPKFWLSDTANDRAIHRLCSLMRKMGAKTAIVETIESDHVEVAGEVKALANYFNGYSLDCEIFKVSINKEIIEGIEEISNEDVLNGFLSSSIVVNFIDPINSQKIAYILSSISTLPKMQVDGCDVALLNNYIHFYRVFQCSVNINGVDNFFPIEGTFFSQQNSYTSVCAHAALCMTLNNFNYGHSDELILPNYVNEKCGLSYTHEGGKSEGLTSEKIANFLKDVGYSINQKNFTEEPNEDYAEHIYSYLESGLPTLLIFATKVGAASHIVPIIGHTLNSDMWLPEAKFAYTGGIGSFNSHQASSWVDHFIMHDDNFGMYFCLPVDSLRRVTLPKYDPSFRALHCIAIIPKGVTENAKFTEYCSIRLLSNILHTYYTHDPEALKCNFWLNQLLHKHQRSLVTRTLLVTREDYIATLAQTDFKGKTLSKENIKDIQSVFPDVAWLTEISLPDLFTANKSKLCDFIYPATTIIKNSEDFSREWLFARLPGQIMLRGVGAGGEDVITVEDTESFNHYPLFRKIEKDVRTEW